MIKPSVYVDRLAYSAWMDHSALGGRDYHVQSVPDCVVVVRSCGRFFSETPEEEENHGAATEAA